MIQRKILNKMESSKSTKNNLNRKLLLKSRAVARHLKNRRMFQRKLT